MYNTLIYRVFTRTCRLWNNWSLFPRINHRRVFTLSLSRTHTRIHIVIAVRVWMYNIITVGVVRISGTGNGEEICNARASRS